MWYCFVMVVVALMAHPVSARDQHNGADLQGGVLKYQQRPETFKNFIALLARVSKLEMEKMPKVMADLNRTINQHIHTSEDEREKQQLLLTSMNTTLVSLVATVEIIKVELQQIQSSLNIKAKSQECYEVQEGEIVLNNNCTISECHKGYLRPYEGARAANVSFSDLLAKKCVHVNETRRTWYDARDNCVALGGDLFVAGDLPGALIYTNTTFHDFDVWAGVEARAWLDGRNVTLQEWRNKGLDGGPDQCGNIYYNGVKNDPCIRNYYSLCQKGVRYAQ